MEQNAPDCVEPRQEKIFPGRLAERSSPARNYLRAGFSYSNLVVGVDPLHKTSCACKQERDDHPPAEGEEEV